MCFEIIYFVHFRHQRSSAPCRVLAGAESLQNLVSYLHMYPPEPPHHKFIRQRKFDSNSFKASFSKEEISAIELALEWHFNDAWLYGFSKFDEIGGVT